MDGLIWFLVVGLIAGWLAGKIMKGGGFGFVGDLVIGVVGALIGGFVFSLLGLGAHNIIGSIIMATIGAILLLLLIKHFKKA